jgi:uncharacterized membrane protein (UPF0182 family)
MTPDFAIAWLLFNVSLITIMLVWGIIRYRRGIWYRKLSLKVQAYLLWAIGGVALLSSIFPFSYLYTEHLWYISVNYADIFWKLRKMRWGIFGGFFLVAFVFMNVNALIANRLCPEPREFARWTHERTASFHRGFFCGTVLLAIVMAIPMMPLQDTFISYLERPTESVEPFLLGKNRNFYLFSFPMHKAIILWVWILLWLTCGVVGLLYNFYYRRDARSKGYVKRNIVFHGSVLWLMLLVVGIWQSYVYLWGKVYTSTITDNLKELHGFFYMDFQLAGTTRIYSGILLLIGVIILINLFTRKRILWYMAICFWGLCYLTLIHVYPFANHWWNVKTYELEKEGEFLKSHIQSTREAFDINAIVEEKYEEEFATLDMVKENPEVVENIQLWDRQVLYDLLLADHRVRHHSFHRFTDVDRYRLGRPTAPNTTKQDQANNGSLENNGTAGSAQTEVSNDADAKTGSPEQYRQVLIAAQEIEPDTQGWRLQKLSFTHGYGIFVSPANEVKDMNPVFWVKGIPNSTKIGDDATTQSQIYYNDKYPELIVTEPRIYYGEMTYDYVIVNTKESEYDLEYNEEKNVTDADGVPIPKKTTKIKYHYGGTGGVKLGGWFRRLCFSIRFSTFRILRNEALHSDSRIMFWRKIGTRRGKKMVTDRLSHIAPFLDYDPDPYMVIDDGQLWWVVDFYVTSKNYPNAQFYEDDTSPTPESNYVEPHYKRFKKFNYIRNSGVAIVNAYSGEVSFYAIKDNEVITRIYDKAFPNLFKDIGEMPVGLQEHLRVPVYLTRIQAKIYGVYHVTDPGQFFNRGDRWRIPTEIYYSESIDQEIMPYYAMLKLPGEDKIEFVNMVPFTPEEKEFKMKAWLVSRCDPPHYGERIVYVLSNPEGVAGPKQVEVDITNELSDKVWADKPLIRGNIQIFPIDRGIFYVEPVYQIPTKDPADAKSTDAIKKRPKLKEVFVAANRIASDISFNEELNEIIVGQKTEEEQEQKGTEEQLPTISDHIEVLAKALEDLRKAIKAEENGKGQGTPKNAGKKKNNKK